MRFEGNFQRGPRYPNGATRSRLYSVFLSYRDFGCTPQKYAEDLAFIALEEKANAPNCIWYPDLDGMLVVGSLQLRDPRIRIVITEDGFELMPQFQDAPVIFIIYAREDYSSAHRLADAVNTAGFRAWLDKASLVPGQRWEIAIAEAIRKTDFVVILLSEKSVKRRGYFHKEIRRALEVLEELPEAKIFLIPARLDDCTPTHSALLKIQWVDLFPEWNAGVTRLLEAVKSARS